MTSFRVSLLYVVSLALAAMGPTVAACSTEQQPDGSRGAPATESPPLGTAEAVSPVPCPVLADVCRSARLLEEALKQGDVDFVIRNSRFREATCPAERPAGMGGPYPLCDGDEGRGQTLLGFTVLNDVTGLTYSVAELEWLLREATDANTNGGDWRVRSVACRQEDVQLATRCSRSVAVFGYEVAGGRLAGTGVLMFELTMATDGGFVVEVITAAFAIPQRDADVLLNGGDLSSTPAHLATFGFGPFRRWRTP